MGGRETFVPSRLLRGVIPSALLEAYQFWRGEGGDLTLRGEPKDPKSQWFGQHIQINLERAPGRAGAGGSGDAGGAAGGAAGKGSGGGDGDRGDNAGAKVGKGSESKAVDSGGGGGGSGRSEGGGKSGGGVVSPLQELLGGAAVWSWQGDLSYAVIRRKPKGVKPKPISHGDRSANDLGGDSGGGGGGGDGGEMEERKEGDKKTEGATGDEKKQQGVVGPGGRQLLRVDSRAGQDRYVQMV